MEGTLMREGRAACPHEGTFPVSCDAIPGSEGMFLSAWGS